MEGDTTMMPPKPRLIDSLLRVAVTVIFLLSGLLKVLAPDRFLLDVQAFGILSYDLAYQAAFLVPWLEIVAAIGLWIRPLRQGAAALLTCLTLGFIGFIIYASAQGTDLDCGCFGEWLVFPSVGAHLTFNTVLLGTLLFLWLRSRPIFFR